MSTLTITQPRRITISARPRAARGFRGPLRYGMVIFLKELRRMRRMLAVVLVLGLIGLTLACSGKRTPTYTSNLAPVVTIDDMEMVVTLDATVGTQAYKEGSVTPTITDKQKDVVWKVRSIEIDTNVSWQAPALDPRDSSLTLKNITATGAVLAPWIADATTDAFLTQQDLQTTGDLVHKTSPFKIYFPGADNFKNDAATSFTWGGMCLSDGQIKMKGRVKVTLETADGILREILVPMTITLNGKTDLLKKTTK